jgi:hypothetical protein
MLFKKPSRYHAFCKYVKFKVGLTSCQLIYEKHQSSRLRLIFRGSFDFFPSKLTKYGNGNYIILNRMKIFNVT